MGAVLAIDAGTTGVRTLAFDEAGALVGSAYRELTQHYPRPGWVEHDPQEIWSHVQATLSDVATRCERAGLAVAAVGITNQRETLVAWNKKTGIPAGPAIVWQDRRSSAICDRLRGAGHEPFVRERTGLVLDPYFTATKMAWWIGTGDCVPRLEVSSDLALATVDSWVAWNLTGGPEGGALVTDSTNASRTLLYDIRSRGWSQDLCELFAVPMSALPTVVASCGEVGVLRGELGSIPALRGVPVAGIAGDQHAALFGQACFHPGMAKVTNGTGSFILLTYGPDVPPTLDGVLSTVAWDLGEHALSGEETARFVYALEGAVFATGAATQWLRDGLGIIADSSEVGALAGQIADTEGVFVVPAFTGLGSPWWDPYARGAIVGLTRGSGRAHVARAVVESMAFQVRDVVDAMSGSIAAQTLRVDGGASVLDLLLQLQADQIQAPVARPTNTETTAFGAAALAGLATGVWGSLAELSGLWQLDREFTPQTSRAAADSKHAGWIRAVQRSRGWAQSD